MPCSSASGTDKYTSWGGSGPGGPTHTHARAYRVVAGSASRGQILADGRLVERRAPQIVVQHALLREPELAERGEQLMHLPLHRTVELVAHDGGAWQKHPPALRTGHTALYR